jgi:hypothetical protein
MESIKIVTSWQELFGNYSENMLPVEFKEITEHWNNLEDAREKWNEKSDFFLK